ncbi:S-layer homology domain-containing protein [Anthocerotibacter panamensis]|uniref:S-layer homology domain-containing protein n=1 Tax=Anthocerotibacter panamensis TaxID=2857077 RepID=UPI001C406667|nr:S-layer homology domain-containing protein [Anthocerotibacter panamensis]
MHYIPLHRLRPKLVALLILLSLHLQVLAQTLDLKWAQPYAEALEQQQKLVLLKEPLENTLTRQELANWLTQTFKLQPNPKKFVSITDIPKDTPDYLNAQAFVQAGLATATGGKFQPKSDYTRLEALALFGRLLKLQAPSKEATDAWLNLYQDGAQIPTQGKPFVSAAAQAGLVINFPNPKELGPDFVLTRGEGIVLLQRALVYQKKIAAVEPPIAQLKLDPPQLTAIEVSPREQTLKTGETLTITAKGTPGSKATFSLGSLARDQILKETEPGVYTGTYKVKEGDYLNNPAVSVALNRVGLEDKKQKVAVVTLGTLPYPSSNNIASSTADDNADSDPNPPRNNYNSSPDNFPPDDPSYSTPPPAPGQNAFNRNPRNTRDPFDAASRLRNSNDPSLDPSNNRYGSVPTPPQQGFDNGRLFNPDLYRPDFRSGSSGRSSDLVGSPNPPQIVQVGYNGKPGRPFAPGDVLEVTLKGEPKGVASFRIEGYTADVKMKEEAQGFYKAAVVIGKNFDIPQGTIRLMLLKDGQSTFRSIPEPISILSRPRATSSQF